MKMEVVTNREIWIVAVILCLINVRNPSVHTVCTTAVQILDITFTAVQMSNRPQSCPDVKSFAVVMLPAGLTCFVLYVAYMICSLFRLHDLFSIQLTTRLHAVIIR